MANHLSFDMLSRLAETRASTAEELRTRRHLASCARCRSELEWLRRIQGGPGRLGGPERGGPELSGPERGGNEGFEATARLHL
jgi:anti-sigma factor RsiW